MIDWLTVSGPLSIEGRIPTGRTLRIDPDGSVSEDWPRPLRVTGSHDASVSVRQSADGTLTIDGCPAKFAQGHNVWGDDRLPQVAAAFFLAVVRRLDLVPTLDDWRAWARGDVTISRADVTYSLPMGSRAAALDTIRRMEATATLAHRGRGQLAKGSTLYFGKNSRRWSLKLYPKGQEIEAPGHRLPLAITAGEHGQAIADHADGLLRIELVIRSMELARLGLDQASAWHDPTTARSLHLRHLGKLTMPVQKLTDADLMDRLPNALRSVYALHRTGEDTRRFYPTRTWYRHRKALLAYGIDLASTPAAEPFDDSKQGQPIPRLDITPNYVDQVPEWAYGTALYSGSQDDDPLSDPPADFFEFVPELFTNPPVWERPDLFEHPDTGEPMTHADLAELQERDDLRSGRPRLRVVSSNDRSDLEQPA